MRTKDFSRDFDAKNFGDMVDFINSIFQNGITLEDNLSGQIIEDIYLPSSGAEISIPHRLKVVPKYRIILRQSNGAIIADGSTAWDDRKIYLRATNSIDSTISVLLLRG